MNAVRVCAGAHGAGGGIGGTNEPASTGQGLRGGLVRKAAGIAACWRRQNGWIARGDVSRSRSRLGLDTGEGRRNQAVAHGPLRAAVCAWMAGMMLAAAGMTAPSAVQAQTEYTILDNSGATTQGGKTITRTNWFAQEFTTGGHDYTLTSVELYFTAVPADGTTQVRLLPQASSAPTTTGAVTLTNPTLTANAWNKFTAPASTTLTANTTYYIELGHTPAQPTGSTSVTWQRKRDQVTTGLTSWSLSGYVNGNPNNADAGTGDGYWTGAEADDMRSLSIRILGTGNTPVTGELVATTGRPRGQPQPPIQVGASMVPDFDDVVDENGLPNPFLGFTYRWERADDDQGSDASDHSTALTFLLVEGDVGKYFRVTLSFTDNFGNSEVIMSDWAGPVLELPNLPTTGTPTFSFTSTVGFRVGTDVTVVTSGFMDDDGLEGDRTDTSRWVFSYYRYPESATAVTDPTTDTGAVLLPSLSGSTITLPAMDGAITVPGGKLVAAVTVTDGRGDQTVLSSALSPVVLDVNVAPTVGANLLTGTLRNGELLTINRNEVSDPNGMTDKFGRGFRYEFFCAEDNVGTNKQRIESSSNPSYRLQNEDENCFVQAELVYTDDENTQERAVSGWQGPVAENDAPAEGNLNISRYLGDPSIDRSPERGETLISSAVNIDDPVDGLTLPVAYQYQWQTADTRTATVGVDIAGATDASYTLTQAEVDKYIRVTVEFEDDEGNPEVKESYWIGPVVIPEHPASGMLTISGTEEVGQTLTATPVSIADRNGRIGAVDSYQWQRLDDAADTTPEDIGDGSLTYTLVAADEGKLIRIVLTFTDDDDFNETITSSLTGAIGELTNNPATGTLTITGTEEVGQTLTATPSNIADADGRTRAADSYQWQRLDDAADTSPDDIGDGSLTYTLVAADQGKLIRIVLTFTDDLGTEETIASDPTGAIGDIMNTPATGTLTIAGTVEVGRTLTATPSNIADANGRVMAVDAYQWQRLDSATDPTPENIGDGSLSYTLVAADQGKLIRIVLIFNDDLGFEERIPSDATTEVLPEGPSEVTVVAQSSFIGEGDNAVFEIRRTGLATGALTVRFTIDDQSGVLSAADATRTSVTMAAGANTVLVSLLAPQDEDDEPYSTVLLTIQSHTSYTFGTPSSAAVVVRDDDGLPPPVVAPPAAIISNAPAVPEGRSLVFSVSLSIPVLQDTEIEYAVSGAGVDAADFSTPLTPALTGTITIPANRAAATLELALRDDAVAERDKTIQVRLTRVLSGNVTLQRQAATGVIRDNDQMPASTPVPGESPTLAIANADPVDEGGTLTFDISLNEQSRANIEVGYRITGIGIEAGDFFLDSLTDSFSIGAGQTSATLTLRTVDDAELEDNETVEILLTRVVSGSVTLQAAAALGVIRDNDASPDALTITDAQTVEGQDLVFVVTLTRSPGTARTVSVDYSVSGGTAASVADFLDTTSRSDSGSATDGRLLFTPDISSRNIVLSTELDFIAEGYGETVEIALFNQSESAVYRDGDAVGQGVISEAPGQSVLSVRSLRASTDSDSNSKVDFQVAVYPALDYDVTVLWRASYTTADVAGAAGGTARSAGVRATGEESGEVTVYRGTNLVPQSFEVDGRIAGSVSIEFERPKRRDTGASVLRGDLAIQPAEPNATDSGRTVVSAETSVRVVDPRARGLSYVLASASRSFAASVVDELWSIADMHAYSNSDSVVLGGHAVSAKALAAGAGGGQAAKEIASFFGVEVAAPYGAHLDSEYSQVSGGGFDSYRQWANVPSIRDLQDQSRFALSLDGQSDGGSSFLFWGGAGRLSGEGGFADDNFGAFDYENEVSSSHLGLGFRRNRFMLGVAFSRKESQMEYQFAGAGLGNGEVTTSVASVTPYVHVVSEDGNSMVWGAYSAGTGTTNSEDDRAELETDIDTQTVAAGLRNGLVTENEGSGLSMRADIFLTSVSSDGLDDEITLEKIDVNSYRMRAAVERESKRAMTTGASVITRMGIGGRVDGGDAEKGIGAEVSMQFGFIAPDRGLSFRGGGSALLAHEDEEFKQWSLGFGLEYAASEGGRGLQMSLKPTWNASLSGDGDTLWASSAKSVTDSAGTADGGGAIQIRLGYGAGMLGEWALATVYGEAGQADEDRSLRLGTELRRVDAGIGQLRFDLYGQREEGAEELPDHTIRLEGRLGF